MKNWIRQMLVYAMSMCVTGVFVARKKRKY